MGAIITTYDFGTKTFGHASMVVGSYFEENTPEIDAAIKEIMEAREKLKKGQPGGCDD